MRRVNAIGWHKRERHARRLKNARTVMNVLMRQAEYHDDIGRLAAALRGILTKDGIAELRRKLRGP
jgi:hypothetical protein